MRKISTTFLAFLCAASLLAQDFVSDGFGCRLAYSSVTIVSGSEKSGDVVIPEKVTYNGTEYAVTGIGKEAFKENYKMTSVTIPASVTEIEDNAFEFCEKLFEVVNKSELDIKAGSEEHGKVALYAKKVTKEESESDFFTDNEGYKFFDDNGNYYLMGYTGTKTDLVLPGKIDGKNYAIHKSAFERKYDLTSVVISDAVTEIGIRSFTAKTSLP